MIGLSPLVMGTGAIALGGWSAPPQPRQNQLKSRLVITLVWTLALLELVVAIALALSQALLMAMILIAPLESSEQGNQPEV